MRIGIIGAMLEEVREIHEAMVVEETLNMARMEFKLGKIGDVEVVCVMSGIAKVNAAVCAQILIDKFNVTHIINTGIAGSLNNDLNIGDFVVSKEVLEHDIDCTALGYDYGVIPQINQLCFEADQELADKIVEAIKETSNEVNVIKGRVSSGEQFVSDAETKDWIKKTYNADCVEMEGGAIAQVAWLNQIPFVIVRAISDKADGSAIMDYVKFEDEASRRSARMMIDVIKKI